ncbi:MAG: hypothetical protein NDI84_19045 [Steroidobacteraceae bacterium]|nr:hypothetical protein [Steroidobacteraceae bacterium]
MPRNCRERAVKKQGKTPGAVVQDAMRAYRLARLRGEYRELQDYWSQRAREKGVLSERQLERYLKQCD